MASILEKIEQTARNEKWNMFNIVEMTDEGTKVVTINSANAANDSYSVAKSVTAIAIGILQDRGILNVQDKIYPILKDFFPNDFDKRWKEVTIEQVLHHRTGSPRGCDFDGEDLLDFNVPDTLNFLFAQPIAYNPGEEMVYADGNYYIISRIVAKVTGTDLENFLQKELFVPLGFHIYAWSRCPLGYALGGTGLFMKTSDMAKIGWLYLNDGVYNGKRILSHEWVKAATTPIDDKYGRYGYGINKDDMNREDFNMAGAFGQTIYVSPKHRRVIAAHSYGGPIIAQLAHGFED